jgi:predicted phage baseplate assembly protein
MLGNLTAPWEPKYDLLNSLPDAPEFVVETESDGWACVRFGNDEYGLRPAAGTTFQATYRVGNGMRGNVGAESLGHIVSSDSAIIAVRNPMAAQGGVDPESMEKVRQDAPVAFRIQERAVTADDYAEVAERHLEVQRAAATVRWTGSWRTVFLTVDRLGGRPVDAAFEQDMRRHLERFRMAGHDVEIDGPRFVPLEIEMFICVQEGYFRSDVQTALLQVFSNTTLADGRRGFFHPDNFTFGQPVYLSQLVATAQGVTGVHYVEVNKFQRLGIESGQAIIDGMLQIGRLEIARLDNDPNFQERGVIRLDLKGGR